MQLKDGPGKDKAMQCVACHSLDYIPMNSRFLDKAGWTASVNKMINVFGAPIPKADVDADRDATSRSTTASRRRSSPVFPWNA